MVENCNQFLLLTGPWEKSATAERNGYENVLLLQKRHSQGSSYILLKGESKGLLNFLENLKPGPTLREDVLSFVQSGATT